MKTEVQSLSSVRFPGNVRDNLWAMALRDCGDTPPTSRASVPYQPSKTHSPFVEMIWQGQAEQDSLPRCAADAYWYLRFLKRNNQTSVYICGPSKLATTVAYHEGDQFLGIRFKVGVFMPRLATNLLVHKSINLPMAMGNSFWLNGTTWEVPTLENADKLVERLIERGELEYDPVVGTALQNQPQNLSPRSVQYRFLRATGLTHQLIQQIERARQAAALLWQGRSILDTVHETGYYDQSHLSNSLRNLIGRTPAQILNLRTSA